MGYRKILILLKKNKHLKQKMKLFLMKKQVFKVKETTPKEFNPTFEI